MTDALINPADPPERQHQKLLQIVEVLMRRVEQATDDGGRAYQQFQRAAMLEDEVRERTRELEHALDLLNASNAQLAEANREAEAARQNLASAIEAVEEGFALFGPDDRLVMCNSRFGLQIPDIRPELIPGISFAEYVTLASRSVHLERPKDESPDAWARQRLARHGEPRAIFNVQLAGDRWAQVSEHRTADGGTVILQTDITDIIRLEREERGKLLDDQAQMIRATLEHIGQGVGIFDAGARLVGWNRRLGLLLDMPAGRFRPGAAFASLADVLAARFSLNADFAMADLLAWVSGPGPRPALSFELTGPGNQVIAVFAEEMPDAGFVMSFADISSERAALVAIAEANETLEQRVTDRTEELAEALGRAEQANATRARFVAAASHDLLQPLSAAKLFIASLEDAGLAQDAQATLGKAANALESVEAILDALLDISKLESGRASVDVVPVELGAILARLSDEFAPVAAAKGLRLTVRPTAATVLTDPTYLRRILQNLIGNAIRYTDKGRVLVGTRRAGPHVRIEVLDTGSGIPEAERANVFREFHRLNARASAAEGMGLGLAIVERACALLGHPLILSSTPGRGTRFSVSVPGVGGALAPEAIASVRQPSPWPEGRIVCLVDRDDRRRRSLATLLERWRLAVIEASDAGGALALLDDIGIVPDRFLIGLDPGDSQDGLALLDTLRARHGKVAARMLSARRDGPALAACTLADVGLLNADTDAVDNVALAAFLMD